MNRLEFIIATAIILFVAFGLGWFTYWLLHRFSRIGGADMGEVDRLAQSLHEAEETRDQAIIYLEQREAELSNQIAQTEAELARRDGRPARRPPRGRGNARLYRADEPRTQEATAPASEPARPAVETISAAAGRQDRRSRRNGACPAPRPGAGPVLRQRPRLPQEGRPLLPADPDLHAAHPSRR